ncbi:hypothetical protein [Stenotrophomonas sp. ZAC14A_NAIMI4_1]|uniref:hypothetical protein n=1 Tax=Stenotrophomonas sp. ZAC14A_NAIMI4_1 TaxID=2072412 RepID=UPI000D541E31|nr:hypothetical protein [Stenotrophomonas sp. ZAC14A_NAIMI4_1]AWH46339.1 hypothetical protein C1926_15565 [Stenotrophomonas sp. ZAC14A_NAIMI4_1]
MSSEAPTITPEVESLFFRLEHALYTAEGMATMINENEPPDPAAHGRPGYNVHKVSSAIIAVSQRGRRLLGELRAHHGPITLH